MSEARNYTGGCHCGAVRYAVKIALDKPMVCNCSICSKAGWRLAFAPASDFALLSGADALQDYQFAKKNLHHPFCKTCGVRAFSRGPGPDGSESVAINVRCLDGVDAEALEVVHYDGAKI
jgi:hypothetical protein